MNFEVKVRVNKKTGALDLNPGKKQFSKKDLDKLMKSKKLKLKVVKW